MWAIQPRITTNILNSDGYNDILEGIDHTISMMAAIQYNNDTLGFQEKVDYRLVKNLRRYRDILLDKFLGCNCLEDEYTIYIISRIQTMIC